MLNDEEITHLVSALGDLETDLLNGNIPMSEKQIISLCGFLTRKQPFEWRSLAAFVIGLLDEAESRIALLHLVPKVKEKICPFQPDQEAVKE